MIQCELEASAKQLWDTFQDAFAEDYLRRYPRELALDNALQDIQNVLATKVQDFKNEKFHLPAPKGFDRQAFLDRELIAETKHDKPEERAEAEKMIGLLYAEQKEAFTETNKLLDSDGEGLVFVDGPGGSGKSFLFEALVHHCRSRGEMAVACAWSGLAASQLPGGRTACSRFGLPVPLPESDVQCSVSATTAKGKLLKAARA